MNGSATEPDSHLIAINFHRYHNLDAALTCCASVKRAVEPLLDGTGRRVSIVLFCACSRAVYCEVSERVKELGIEARHLPEGANGDSLNMQIEYALDEGFDFFYRVDADDLVYEDRFVRQAEILTSTSYDICGGGLLYRNVADGTRFKVVPPETPAAASFVFSMFFLHPTLAFRLKTFRTHDIKYWPQRLEDKHLALQARFAGMRVYNDPYIYGEYNLEPNARNGREAAKTSLMLDLRFLMLSKDYIFIPVALGIYLLRLLVSTQTPRNMRNKVLRCRSRLSLSAFSRPRISGD
jgi:hypothetical protein